MTASKKTLLRALNGETLPTPPVWLMRQAGRYLPEYRATREKAGSFLDLCYTPELAVEVTMQPIRRYGFDAAILFADILLIPQALGADLRFDPGEGPRLSTISGEDDLRKLRPADEIHRTLSPVYETVEGLASSLPSETALIGFAGSPWTVATYMIAGKGTPDQMPARRLILEDPDTFDRLIDLLVDATTAYLSRQVEAGAEAVKLFDSWAGTLNETDFDRYCVEPTRRIVEALRNQWPSLPVIGFPRGAGASYEGFAERTGVSAVAIDQTVPARWAKDRLQTETTVQGNLDPLLLVTGGSNLESETKRLVETLGDGPHIFNLGHGITPDAEPANVDRLLKAIRG